jgi:hypothetical protein
MIIIACQGRLRLHSNWYSIYLFVFFFCSKASCVVMFRWCQGSPVHRYGLYALQWIVEVNGKPTPDLETFIKVAQVCCISKKRTKSHTPTKIGKKRDTKQ